MLIHDCPECRSWASIYIFVASPLIFQCRNCRFVFEFRELTKFKHHPDF